MVGAFEPVHEAEFRVEDECCAIAVGRAVGKTDAVRGDLGTGGFGAAFEEFERREADAEMEHVGCPISKKSLRGAVRHYGRRVD